MIGGIPHLSSSRERGEGGVKERVKGEREEGKKGGPFLLILLLVYSIV